MNISIDAIPKLSDDELFDALKKCSLTVGPITSTTRSIYEKRLIGHILNPKLSFDKPKSFTTATIETKERADAQSRPEPPTSFDSLYTVRKDDITKSIDSKIQQLRSTDAFAQPSLSTPQKTALPGTPQTADKFANRLNSYGLLNSSSKSSAKDYTSSIQTLSAMKQSTVMPSVVSSFREKACDKQLFASTISTASDSQPSSTLLRKRIEDDPMRILGRRDMRDSRDYESKVNRVLGTTSTELKTASTTTAPNVATKAPAKSETAAVGSSNVKTFILVALFTIIAYFLFIQYQAITAPPNIEL